MFSVSLSLSAIAQSAMVAAGESSSGTSGSVSYSIGQMMYVATDTENENFSGGVQQAYELLFVSVEVLVIEHYSGKMLILDNHDGLFVSFRWYKDGREVGTQNYYYEAAGLDGIYYLEVLDKDGKVYRSQRFSYTLSTVFARSLSVYPVPAIRGDNVTAFFSDETLKGQDTKVQMHIYDTVGKLVLNQKVNYNIPITISTSSVRRGSYIVKFGDVSSKIIIQ